MNKVEELKEKAKKILGNLTIQDSSEELEFNKELNRIGYSDDINLEQDEKILNQIELYFLIKDKMNKVEENYNYLKDVASKLREQKVRSSDLVKGIPLFKVDKNNERHYFLTREKAKEFKEANNLGDDEIIDIEENENEKLEYLIKTIKENF